MTVWRKLRTFARMGRARQALTMEAFATLAFARLWLALRPFNKVARALGEQSTPGDDSAILADPATKQVAREVSRALRLVAERAPFKAVCLQQAVAGKLMLRRRGIDSVIHFGVARQADAAQIEAHAWLDAGSVRMTGYPVPPEFVEVATLR